MTMADNLLFPDFSGRGTEWLGGCYTFPGLIRDGNYQPEVVMWVEMPSGFIVAVNVFDPKGPNPFVETLLEALDNLPHGASRPSRIRVAGRELADKSRLALGGRLPVVNAPVPELDEAFEAFAASMDSTADPTYLGDGEIAPEAMETLFAAAARYFRAAPWRWMPDDRLVRVDIPRLGIEGGCLSVIGAAEESFGLLLFSSIDAFVDFSTTPPEVRDGVSAKAEEPGGFFMLSLSFDRRGDVPPKMLAEIKRYRWPVAGAKGYPIVFAITEARRPRPVSAREIAIMTAATSAFVAFFDRHGDVLRSGRTEPVTEVFRGEDGVTVTLAVPVPLPAWEEWPESPDHEEEHAGWVEVGRNDPCPCGSGKKYKKCHLASDEARRTAGGIDEHTKVHQMDFTLVGDIMRFASKRFGAQWFGRAGKDFDGDEEALALYLPWLAWTAVAEGRRVAEVFLDEKQSQLGRDEVEWFASQRKAWLSVWEVTAVRPGESIDLRDLLTGETRTVIERLASESLRVRDAILTRVAGYRATSVLAGLFARALPPIEAAEFVKRVRARLRMAKRPVPVERLQDPMTGRFMIDLWQGFIDDMDERNDPAGPQPGMRDLDAKSTRGPTAAEQALLRKAKTAHYREWLDEPIPFLDDKTPRAAARSAKSRERLDLLLRDLENREARLPEAQRLDVAWLRRELGMD